MPRSKGDGAKVSLKIRPAMHKSLLNSTNWEALERLLEVSLQEETREEIDFACVAYANVGKLHSSGATVSARSSTEALEAWIKASHRLMAFLGEAQMTKKLDKAALADALFTAKAIQKLKKSTPLGLVSFLLGLTIGTALEAVEQMPRRKLSPTLKNDLGLAWLQLIALSLQHAGAKTTASNSPTGPESLIVQAVLYLQRHLPDYCRPFNTKSTAAKAVHRAKQKFGSHGDVKLKRFLILVGSGFFASEHLDRLPAERTIINKSLRDELSKIAKYNSR